MASLADSNCAFCRDNDLLYFLLKDIINRGPRRANKRTRKGKAKVVPPAPAPPN
jgi:hypothetical protein